MKIFPEEASHRKDSKGHLYLRYDRCSLLVDWKSSARDTADRGLWLVWYACQKIRGF